MIKTLYIKLGRLAYWMAWPVSWLYLRWSQRTRLLIICGQEVLVVDNWLGDGRYNLPGGGLRRGENPAKGLVREVREEIGVVISEAALWYLSDEMYHTHGFRYRCHYFAVRMDQKPAVTPQKFEIIDIVWSNCDEISSKTHGADVFRALELLDRHRGL